MPFFIFPSKWRTSDVPWSSPRAPAPPAAISPSNPSSRLCSAKRLRKSLSSTVAPPSSWVRFKPHVPVPSLPRWLCTALILSCEILPPSGKPIFGRQPTQLTSNPIGTYSPRVRHLVLSVHHSNFPLGPKVDNRFRGTFLHPWGNK